MSKEKRNLFQKFFGNNNQQQQKQLSSATQFKLLNDYIPIFYNFSGDLYDSDVVRSAVHSIAVHIAELKPKHIRRTGSAIDIVDSDISYMLQTRPNEFMNSYDFIYKIVSQLCINNNAFVYIKYDNFGKLQGFYPINYSFLDLIEVENSDDLYVRFQFYNGQTMTLPYSELIHIRRHFNSSDIFGSSNSKPLNPLLNVVDTVNQGIINSIKSSAHLRGLLKYTQGMLKDEVLKQHKDDFMADYMNLDNNGGIAALDAKAEFQQLDLKPTLIDDKQMAIVRDSVYRYFNTNEAIVTNNYSESQWQAFYNGVVQPISIQLSLEFTGKLFTDREKGFGNEILFESNRFAYMSTASKVAMIKELMPVGLLSRNEAREMFNLSSIPDGDKRLMSLNYIDIDKANEYQLGITNKNALEEDKNIEESEVEDDGTSKEGNTTSGTKD